MDIVKYSFSVFQVKKVWTGAGQDGVKSQRLGQLASKGSLDKAVGKCDAMNTGSTDVTQNADTNNMNESQVFSVCFLRVKHRGCITFTIS